MATPANSALASSNAATVIIQPSRTSKKKALIWLAIIGAIIILILIWPKSNGQSTPTVDESKKVCPAAWQQEQDHVNDYRDADIPYFDIKLTQDACFEGNIYPPKAWQNWEKEFISNEPDRHVSFWFHGSDPVGPFGANNMREFDYAPREWRLKGKGTLRYFRTR